MFSRTRITESTGIYSGACAGLGHCGRAVFYVMAAATVAAANGEADHNFSFQGYRKISECLKIMEMKTMDRRLIEFVGLTIPAGFVLPEDVHDEIVTFRSEVLFFH